MNKSDNKNYKKKRNIFQTSFNLLEFLFVILNTKVLEFRFNMADYDL